MNDLESSDLGTPSRRKGSKRLSLTSDQNPATLKSPLPTPTIPLDVGRKLQAAMDQVERLKSEIQQLKGAKTYALKQVDLSLAKVEKLQLKLGSAEEVKKWCNNYPKSEKI